MKSARALGNLPAIILVIMGMYVVITTMFAVSRGKRDGKTKGWLLTKTTAGLLFLLSFGISVSFTLSGTKQPVFSESIDIFLWILVVLSTITALILDILSPPGFWKKNFGEEEKD